jgi:hypothetical protein
MRLWRGRKMKKGFEDKVNQSVTDALARSWPLNEKLVHFLAGVKPEEKFGDVKLAITPVTARDSSVGVDITASKGRDSHTLRIDLQVSGQYTLTEDGTASEPLGANMAFLRIQQWLNEQGEASGVNFLDAIHRNNEAAATAARDAAARAGAARKRDPKAV